MNIASTAVKRPVTTLMLMMIIVILGAISFLKLPVDLFPKMEFPVAIVMVSYPNAGPEEIESLVTRPLERQLSTVEKLKSLSSVSADGTSMVIVQFEDGTDMKFSSLNMREKVDMIKDFLPEGATKPMIMTIDPSMMPIMELYASSDMELTELYTLLTDEILPYFERTEGVADAAIFGGVEEEVKVTVDQEKLSGYHMSLTQISQLLAAENINLPSGTVDKGSKKMVIRTIGEFGSAEDMRNIPLTLATREVIRLGDIATISEGVAEQTSIARVNGNPAIGLNITKQSTSNTVTAADSVMETLKEIQTKYPQVEFTISFNQADYVKSSVASVEEAAILGCLFAILVIFIFFRNTAATLVIGISIPTSIIATFILMYFAGISLNMLSLGGLAIGVGMLVDDSIVVLENIFRVKNEENVSAQEAAIIGTKQVMMPVFAATMTKIAVFLPIVFAEGMAATMFKEFSYTISFALLASLLVSFTVVPMISSRVLHADQIQEGIRIKKFRYKFRILPKISQFIEYTIDEYQKILTYSLRHRRKTIIASILILLISVSSVAVVGGELFPTSDESSFSINVNTPFGTSLVEKDQVLSELEEYVSSNIPETESYTTSIGGGSMYSMGTSDSSTIRVNLVGKNDRDLSTEEVANRTRDDLKKLSTADITVQLESMTAAMGGGATPIQLYLRGDDLATLKQVSDDFVKIISEIEGTADTSADLTEGNPEVKVTLNRSNAGYFGITAYQLANALESSLSGSTATTLKVNGGEIDVKLSLNATYQESVENLKQILIPTATGQMVPVGQVAEFSYGNSPSQINRQDQIRTVTIGSSLSGRDLQSVSNDIKVALDSYDMPSGYTYEFAGTQKEMVETFSSLLQALALSIVLVFMILASQFESLVQPGIIMMAIPFALTGAFLSLFLVGMPLSMPAFMGIIMLVGIVVNNSILLIDFINANRHVYATREEAILMAGKYRFRPIIMTMLTTSLGLVPIALALREGSELEAPMGVTVIGGLIFSTLITLVIVPVIYAIVDDRTERKKAKRMAKKTKADMPSEG